MSERMSDVAEGLSAPKKDVAREQQLEMDPGPLRVEQSDPGHLREHDWGRTCPPTAQLFGNDYSGRRIKDDLASARATAEVKHVVQRARNRIRRAVSDPAEVPIVFDEPQNRRLVRYRVVDEVLLCPGRDYQQWQPRAKAAATILRPAADIIRLWRTTIAWPQQLVVRHIRLGHDRPHLMVVPAVGIIPRDDYSRFIPLRTLHERVDHADDKNLFVDWIRVSGMAILVGASLQVRDGRQAALA